MFYFPMAGLSSRFTAAGYGKPKYYLDIGSLSLFQASLKGFSRYFDSDGFCFVYLEKLIDESTIRLWAEEIGLPRSNCLTVPLSSTTKGQAETVHLGVKAASGLNDKSEEVIIFNIDTIYHDFMKPDSGAVHYLDVTKLQGTHWSFVEPHLDKPYQAQRVVEKDRISELCSVGLYGFGSSQSFSNYYARLYGAEHGEKEEYVAPMYQQLIDDGFSVHFREFPSKQFDFLGTPKEYEDYLRKQSDTKNSLNPS
jgi:hypothetical protein